MGSVAVVSAPVDMHRVEVGERVWRGSVLDIVVEVDRDRGLVRLFDQNEWVTPCGLVSFVPEVAQ
jgi:hypothetical protein